MPDPEFFGLRSRPMHADTVGSTALQNDQCTLYLDLFLHQHILLGVVCVHGPNMGNTYRSICSVKRSGVLLRMLFILCALTYIKHSLETLAIIKTK